MKLFKDLPLKLHYSISTRALSEFPSISFNTWRIHSFISFTHCPSPFYLISGYFSIVFECDTSARSLCIVQHVQDDTLSR